MKNNFQKLKEELQEETKIKVTKKKIPNKSYYDRKVWEFYVKGHNEPIASFETDKEPERGTRKIVVTRYFSWEDSVLRNKFGIDTNKKPAKSFFYEGGGGTGGRVYKTIKKEQVEKKLQSFLDDPTQNAHKTIERFE
jgi:hypothetical protein